MPNEEREDALLKVYEHQYLVELRDRIAIAAMVVIISKLPLVDVVEDENGGCDVDEEVALGAYDYADSMMRVRAE